MTKDGLYKHVTIRINKAQVISKTENGKVDYQEVLIGVLTVEKGHLKTKEQIEADNALLEDGFGYIPTGIDVEEATKNLERRQELTKNAYESILNEAAKNQIDYRKEKGQEITQSVFMILFGAKTKSADFGKTGLSEGMMKYFEDNGGKYK